LPLVAVRSAGTFGGSLRTAIHRLKYYGRRSAGPALGELLVAPAAQAIGALGGPDSLIRVVPVPLHPRRERERGYNQAALLAAPLAEGLGFAVDSRTLRRVKDTASLVRLSRGARRAEMEGAFTAVAPLGGSAILLVDDVATTCSTLASAARACLAAGASGVAAVTLAREV
jgi:ComF family protein